MRRHRSQPEPHWAMILRSNSASSIEWLILIVWIELRNDSEGMRKVLIVEDDQAMAVALRDGFTYEGYAVEVARDGHAGLRMAAGDGLDLVILDVMLPKMSGLDVCKQLRSDGNNTP